MKHHILIAISLMCLNNEIWAQTSQSIHPTVLIDARNGSGPGEFKIDRLPELDIPFHAMTVDDLGHIYLLDPWNNRLQQFDQMGKFIGVISLPSSSKTTEKELELSPMLPRTMITVDFVDCVNGQVYAVQQRRPISSKDPGHLFRLQDDSFVNADGDKDAGNIRKKLSKLFFRYERKSRLKNAFAALGVSQETFLNQHPSEKNPWIITFDKNKNTWVVSYRGVNVYGPNGNPIYTEQMGTQEALVSQGNLYLLSYPDSGVRVTKYSLQGK